ncbi:16S rRNA (guanine(966)-N(2))-methyltransferase RsmD [Caulobacter sp. UNC279MFTsu5.1]|uniref:16S rRNA (guanine(966)-N(2))-methyltransferase RsmD n=1 Tax=Caulobacter sp. UNC279MFTsu5.1 TaxID=1502775 RepID=UPI0008E9451E|nr:16S rRNA (guanine(966)-N(2))-methyltransferase RsmD [Caulobacter sp. UNC279MFTsu5.1]SFK17556.1 16S rRNA (guanine966-N2)-methyltransferase [Caulobacter sp. UNC279MFTsu5.1]
MRIVSGRYRGKAIVTPSGDTTRPTSDRARQAVFNILEHAAWAPELNGARAIDLFAGSGALGLEAMSRGADFCLFVETDDAARGAIRENLEAFGLFGQARVHRRDATDLGPRPGSVGAPFDIAFLDPPYARGLGEKALDQLVAGGWLAPGAIVMFERGRDEADPAPAGFERLDARDYGAAKVFFFRAPR